MNSEELYNDLFKRIESWIGDFFQKYRYSLYFPQNCYLASAIIYDYLTKCGYDCEIVFGNIRNLGRRRKARFHCWVEVGDYVIDMTKFQFYMNKEDIDGLYDLTDEYVSYKICNLQDKFIIKKNEYYTEFYKTKKHIEYKNPFKDIDIEESDHISKILYKYLSRYVTADDVVAVESYRI